MATVKLKSPPELSGNNSNDIRELQSYLVYLQNNLNYHLNNLDDENILSNTSESEEE